MATVVNPSAVAQSCPICSTKGRRVAPLTVRALVKPELVDQVCDEPYRFCESPACEVVYFSDKNPAHRFHRADIRVQVGQKATEPPIQVCYCFDWTTDDIEGELRLTGATTIPDRIKVKIEQGYCQCETMNPQGSCCLGNVNRAVKEVRAKLALTGGVAAGQVVRAKGGQETEKGAFLATLGAVFTAIIASACCWLPLLLIAFGLSAAGVGTFFEEYRPYFLAATFALLGSAWYFTYRTTIWRFWARRTGSPAPAAAGESCSQPPSAAAHSCCATDLEAESCCAQPAKAGQATRRRLTLHQFNQLMLWIATIIIVLLALFPSWIGLILGSTGSPPEGINLSDQEQVVVEIQGLSCAACAPAVEKALRNVPGVWAASVNYEKAQAVVLVPKGHDMPRAAILQAVHQAGYSATFRK